MHQIPYELQINLLTQNGPICGYVDKSSQGIYYKFKRIPYAKPPLGDLRFKPPQPIDSWTHLLDCTEDGPPPMFMQPTEHSWEIEGSEDCLYIEISSPNIKPEKLLPVMFWIGTAYFILYSDNIYDPSLINDQNIVFVRCGFRLGPFGFLSIQECCAPGNNGLKDIVMALKWVKNNIKYFGGDHDNVTLFGSSTGGCMVHFMILSPMAAGLFHKAIIQSASAINRWAIDMNPIQNVMLLAIEMGINKTDKLEILEELIKKDAIDIIRASNVVWRHKAELEDCEMFNSLFKPCIEVEVEGQPVFLNKSPELILKSGKINAVPMIIGCNNTEAALLQYIKRDFYTDFEKFNEDVSLILPKTLSSLDAITTKKIGQKVIDFYFRGEVKENDKMKYLQFLSDCLCTYYIYRTIRLHNQLGSHCPIYYYILNFSGKWSVPELLNFYNSTGHFADIPFLFRIKIQDTYCEGCQDSINIRRKVVKMWTNFSKYGNLTPYASDEDLKITWDPVINEKQLNYAGIGQVAAPNYGELRNPTPYEYEEDLKITWDPVINEKQLNYLSIECVLKKGQNPFQERMIFWDKLHQDHKLLKTLLYFNDIGVNTFT